MVDLRSNHRAGVNKRTWIATLATGGETGYVDSVEVVGAESREGEIEKSTDEW